MSAAKETVESHPEATVLHDDNTKVDTSSSTSDEKQNRVAPETDIAEPPLDPEKDYPHGLKLILLLVALCFSVFLVALDQTIIATAIPKITDQFDSIKDIGWYGSAYLLTSTALQPTFGRIYTIFNIKWMFLSAICLFELGSLICGVAPSSTALIIGRGIAGLGGAGIFSGAAVILAYSLPLAKRPAAFGLLGGMWGISSVAGPLLGGVFTDKATWRWCFYINLPIGVVAVGVVLVCLHITRDNNPDNLTTLQRILKLDLIGAGVLIPTIVCFLLPLQWGGTTYAWNSATIIGLFCAFAVLLLIFIYTQYRLGDKGTFPPRLFRNRSVFAALAFSFFFGAGFFALIFYIAIYFQSVKGASATQAGIDLLPLLISVVLCSMVTGGLISVVGYYQPFLVVCMALFATGAGLMTTFNLDTPFARWFGFQVVTGFGVGVGFQGGAITIQTVLPLVDVPVGTALVSFFQTLGGSLFIAAAQTIFQNGIITGIAEYAPTVPAQLFLANGATTIRYVLAEIGQEDQLDNVLQAYVLALSHTFYIAVGCAIAAFVAACCLENRSVKKGGPQKTKTKTKTKTKDEEGGDATVPMSTKKEATVLS